MADLKICRICVQTEAKMYHIDQYQLKFYFEEFMAFNINDQDGLPYYLCYECATILHKFHKFKDKCIIGQKVLKNLLQKGAITPESMNKIDHSETMLKSSLSIITVNNRVKTYCFTYSKENTDIVYIDDGIEKVGLDNMSEISFSDDEKIDSDDEKIDSDDAKINSENKKIQSEQKDTNINMNSMVVLVKSENNILKTELEKKKKKKVINKTGRTKNSSFSRFKFLDNKDHWKVTVLNEEDAMKEFRAKVEDKKYLAAPFKCKECFKWFSKKDMLDRHIQLRHIEQLGPLECHFCRYRFKMECYLKKHIKQHYTRYKCLRCHLLCPLVNTALLHEEYHSGVTKKCNYCGEEFRHSSTYYTHLRTHRSEHVCTLCGGSFVSELGLRQHKQIKHVIIEIESPDDDEDVNTFCQRCDIRFETRKAYEEHLFHSALHSDEEGLNKDGKKLNADKPDDSSRQEKQEKLSTSRKVLGKKVKAKITNSIRKRPNEEDPFSFFEGKRYKKSSNRRPHVKPTTCHQCGKHFATQQACMKHHTEAHPRTSFHPPNERYICEICGASLAPGSITAHQNIHTRQKLYTCDTCGRQFHAVIGLKRHLLTHTGEKPFGCPLCDKKFTQSNSMKLHYRTFHLKQPYPKRNRRTKKDEAKETVETRESNSDDSSSSYDSLPDVQTRDQSGIDPETGAVTTRPDESMDYLTLT